MDDGTSLHIETHRNSSVKIRVDNDTLTTGTSGVSEVFTSGGTTAVKIYFEETDGDRWYLRVNSDNNEAVEIVSESYVNNVCSHARLSLSIAITQTSHTLKWYGCGLLYSSGSMYISFLLNRIYIT